MYRHMHVHIYIYMYIHIYIYVYKKCTVLTRTCMPGIPMRCPRCHHLSAAQGWTMGDPTKNPKANGKSTNAPNAAPKSWIWEAPKSRTLGSKPCRA